MTRPGVSSIAGASGVASVSVVAAIALLACISGIACAPTRARSSGEFSSAVAPTPQPAVRIITPEDIERGYKALLTYTDIHGQPVSPEPDTRITAVVIFATWCSPCRREIGWLGELIRDESRLQVIGVNYFDEAGEAGDQYVRAFLNENAPWMQVVRADQPLIDSLGQPRYVPTMFLFDAEGRLVMTYLPPARKPPTREELRSHIRALMSDA